MRKVKRWLQLLSGILCIALAACYIIMFSSGDLAPKAEGLDGAVLLLFNLFFGILGIFLLGAIGLFGFILMLPIKKRGRYCEQRILTLINILLEVAAGYAFYIWSTMTTPMPTGLIVLFALTISSGALQLISFFLRHPRPTE